MKFIEITKIQTFPIPEKLTVLVDNNNALKLANETLQKLLIVSLIIIPVLGFVIYKKQQLTKNQNKKQKI